MMATAPLRPQMMRLTDAAANRIKSAMANAGRPIVGVRVGIKDGGCAGMAYTMEYAEKVEPSETPGFLWLSEF
jgi:iron-sulfur cluster assembly protein